MERAGWIEAAAIFAAVGLAGTIGCAQQQVREASSGVPRYQIEPAWPKPLKDNWIVGQVTSVAVDSRDHVWLLHRPNTLLDDEKGAQGNLFTAEVGFGRRVQKFRRQE